MTFQKASFEGSWRKFIMCALILVALAIGLNPTLGALIRHYTKEAIDIRLPLEEFDDSALTTFERQWTGQTLRWTDQELGTDEKFNRLYVEKPDAAVGKPTEVLFHVAYYSDPRYQISHTPEVCFRQDGALIHEIRQVTVNSRDLPDSVETVAARLVHMQRHGEHPLIDVYLFYSNGKTYDDREKLRWARGMPGDRFSYFAKVEIGVVILPGMTVEHAENVAKRFVGEALPILVRNHFPTRTDVQR
jgi:hypothetical protein